MIKRQARETREILAWHTKITAAFRVFSPAFWKKQLSSNGRLATSILSHQLFKNCLNNKFINSLFNEGYVLAVSRLPKNTVDIHKPKWPALLNSLPGNYLTLGCRAFQPWYWRVLAEKDVNKQCWCQLFHADAGLLKIYCHFASRAWTDLLADQSSLRKYIFWQVTKWPIKRSGDVKTLSYLYTSFSTHALHILICGSSCFSRLDLATSYLY